MEPTQSFNHCTGINPDYFAAGEKTLQNPQRLGIIRVFKNRYDYNSISYIEICVVCGIRSSPSVIFDGMGSFTTVRGVPSWLLDCLRIS